MAIYSFIFQESIGVSDVEEKVQARDEENDMAEKWLCDRYREESPQYGTNYWDEHQQLTSKLPAPTNNTGRCGLTAACLDSPTSDGQ